MVNFIEGFFFVPVVYFMIHSQLHKFVSFICTSGFYGRPWTPDQRVELFDLISSLGLNAYIYAPKDDLKHRAYWRELYSVEEAGRLNKF